MKCATDPVIDKVSSYLYLRPAPKVTEFKAYSVSLKEEFLAPVLA